MNTLSKKIIIDANFPSETRVVLLGKHNKIEEIKSENTNKPQNKGNLYLAKISRIEPSLQAAFIEYGNDKSGFLPFVEINAGYYNIPVSDQKLFIKNLKEITPPTITNDDMSEQPVDLDPIDIAGKEEIDLNAIKKLVDETLEPEFILETTENEIDNIEAEHKEKLTEKQYKIQEVLKKGQILLVQLTKEERGNKGASFTTYISLAGKYCVLMPNKSSNNGVSRKISNAEERKRLKNIISNLSNDASTASVIARTAAIGHTTFEIKKDYDYLVRLWNNIRNATLQSSAPCFIHQEEGIIKKVIRDMFDRHVDSLLIQGTESYKKAVKFIQDIAPADVNKIKEYKNKVPIFTEYKIEEQLMKLYQPIVALNSGGYIVINPTEALISIDVNSGKSTSESNIEETALKTNLEAAREIALQVKLRDLSGLLVIDFIDMQEFRNRKIVERSFKEFLSFDRAKIQISGISNFGLLEMSRQRMQSSFLESNTSICSHCSGKGLVRADESNAMLILRTIENEIFTSTSHEVDILNIYANSLAIIYLLNNKRQEINFIEEKYKIKLNFYIDPIATSDNYSLEKIKLSKSQNTAINGISSAPITGGAKIKSSNKKKNISKDFNKHLETSEETPDLLQTVASDISQEILQKNDRENQVLDRKKPNYKNRSKPQTAKRIFDTQEEVLNTDEIIISDKIIEPTVTESVVEVIALPQESPELIADTGIKPQSKNSRRRYIYKKRMNKGQQNKKQVAENIIGSGD